MRWLSFERNGEASFGRVVDGGVVDAGNRTGIPTLKAAIARGLEEVAAEAGDTADCALDEITYLPTITDPDKILCVGLNYRDHQEETGRGGEDNPTIFVRFAAAQVGHLGKMLRPSESDSLDFEGEIALVVGRPGRRIAPANWLDHIAGFSCYNDGSVREYQRHTSQFTPGKNFAATGGFGPWMVTPDEIDDYDDIEITTRLNGEVMQNARSAQLV
ncbi:MAG: fumarylacetoacetate hydrolase family protein, partial [Gammaproteobacteria bacterium]|nr:fumarylacetoacetate hydrolase family protein [Gammaproteobacteria bacterium]